MAKTSSPPPPPRRNNPGPPSKYNDNGLRKDHTVDKQGRVYPDFKKNSADKAGVEKFIKGGVGGKPVSPETARNLRNSVSMPAPPPPSRQGGNGPRVNKLSEGALTKRAAEDYDRGSFGPHSDYSKPTKAAPPPPRGQTKKSPPPPPSQTKPKAAPAKKGLFGRKKGK